MDPSSKKREVYEAPQMAVLIHQEPKRWFLLEILREDENGRALEMSLLHKADSKGGLLEYLMEEDEDWDWGRKYIMVYSDPGKPCDFL